MKNFKEKNMANIKEKNRKENISKILKKKYQKS